MVFNQLSERYYALVVKFVFNLGRLSPLKVEKGSQKMLYCTAFWKFFCIVAYNVKHFFCVIGNYTGKCSNFSICVISTLLPTSRKNNQHCWQLHGKLFKFEYHRKFKTICEFTPGFQPGAQADVFHEVRNLVGLSL